MSTQPTDDEIKDLYLQETGFNLDDSPDALLDFARAVLKKWGTPATGGEPVACNCKATDMRLGVCCKVRAAFEEWYDQQQDGRIQPFDVWLAAWKGGRKSVGTSPQPVREPLSDEQIQDLIGFGDPTEQGKHLIRKGFDAAHGIGITGGQYG